MSDALINKGITVVGKAKKSKRPIVVVGTARGGTSMIAGALAKLGVFMGDLAVPPVYEDVRLSAVFEKNDIDAIHAIISEYSNQYQKWGWKRPSSIDYLDKVNDLMQSPSYVFIFKDILSIAQRNTISMLSEVLPGMERALKQYGNCLEFLHKSNHHAMLISYDKAVSNPENLINQLKEFYDLSPSAQQLEAAIAFVKPNPTDYLDASRITKAHGRLGGLQNRTVYGWAKFLHKEQSATVEIYLNDSKLGETIANKNRADLQEKFGVSCAYYFNLPETVQIKIGDSLRARVVSEVIDLDNSPLEINI